MTEQATAAAAAIPAWYSTAFTQDDAGVRDWVLALHENTRHPFDARIPTTSSVPMVATDPTAAGVVRFRQTPDDRVVVTFIDVRGHAAGGSGAQAPPLCYVLSCEPTAQPPATALVAFLGGPREGRVLSPAEAERSGMAAASQLAAVRWWHETGQLHQIYVDPRWRRHKVATKLLVAAALVRAAQGTPPLFSGGHRTDLGELFVSATPASWSPRISRRTSTAPPMTPPANQLRKV